MSRNVKIIIAIIFVVLVIVICCFTFGKNKKEETANDVAQESIVENENVENVSNVVNEIESNTVENEVVEDEEPVVENVTEVKEQGTVYESNSDTGTTDRKQDAIALVKEKWGEDSTVTFRCDSVTNNGEYIIAVVSKETASVKNYFKVNLSTKTVEVDY